jgi:hypothetical protein
MSTANSSRRRAAVRARPRAWRGARGKRCGSACLAGLPPARPRPLANRKWGFNQIESEYMYARNESSFCHHRRVARRKSVTCW